VKLAGAAAPFEDRHDGGRALARELSDYRGRDDVVVLGLPRGGVPVAFEVASALRAPLDVFVARKLGVPGHEELALGAIASGGVRVLNERVLRELSVRPEQVEEITAAEAQELERRERLYRGDAGPVAVEGRVAILVDDGLATGASMRAAVQALRGRDPGSVVVAVPVAARQACPAFDDLVDRTVWARTPEHLAAVGQWYRDFTQTSDEEVRALLDLAASAPWRLRPPRTG